MTTFTFREITCQAIRRGTCPVCGKQGQRKTTLAQTGSPYNRNPDGTVRTRDEIWQALKDEADAWESVPFVHARCEGGEQA